MNGQAEGREEAEAGEGRRGRGRFRSSETPARSVRVAATVIGAIACGKRAGFNCGIRGTPQSSSFRSSTEVNRS